MIPFQRDSNCAQRKGEFKGLQKHRTITQTDRGQCEEDEAQGISCWWFNFPVPPQMPSHPHAAVLCMINGDVAKLLRSAGAPDSALGSAQVGPEVIPAKCLHSEAVLLGPSSARSKDEFPSVQNILTHPASISWALTLPRTILESGDGLQWPNGQNRNGSPPRASILVFEGTDRKQMKCVIKMIVFSDGDENHGEKERKQGRKIEEILTRVCAVRFDRVFREALTQSWEWCRKQKEMRQ